MPCGRKLSEAMTGRAYLALLPWLVFAFVGRASLEGAGWAGASAALTAAALTVAATRARSPKLLEPFAVVLFSAFAVADALSRNDPDSLLQRYHNAFATGALALFTLASLVVSPFTRQYARELVPRRLWETEEFERANVELTRLWISVFVAVAGSQAIGAAMGTRLALTLFMWIVPVALVLLGVRGAARRWNDRFDGESIDLSGLVDQLGVWDAPLSGRRELPASERRRDSSIP